MSEIQNQIFKLQSIIAGAKRELKTLNIRGRNSINLIRSKLDLLNLNDEEDLTDLEIESAEVEFNELKSTIQKIQELKEKQTTAEKEIKNIKKAIGE